MKKSLTFWQFLGFVLTGIVGTLLHFLYDWTGSDFVALFSAVNESIWEHLKLLFYPMVAFALIEYFRWGKENPSFWCIKMIGILTGITLIPVIYYTYTGILGVNADWFNITLFFLVAGFVYWLETKLFRREFVCKFAGRWAFAMICVIAVVFAVFTFLPPEIPFFRDPMTLTYGY